MLVVIKILEMVFVAGSLVLNYHCLKTGEGDRLYLKMTTSLCIITACLHDFMNLYPDMYSLLIIPGIMAVLCVLCDAENKTEDTKELFRLIPVVVWGITTGLVCIRTISFVMEESVGEGIRYLLSNAIYIGLLIVFIIRRKML